jgi:integrase
MIITPDDIEPRLVPTVRSPKDFVKLVQSASNYANESMSLKTRQCYETAWKKFVAFCNGNGLNSNPTTIPVLCVYVSYLADMQLSISSVWAAISAVKYYNGKSGTYIDTGDPRLLAVISGIRRTTTVKVKKSDAILADDLRKIVVSIHNYVLDPLKRKRDLAILLILFSAALRRGELRAIKYEHLQFVTEGLVLTIPKSKTDQEQQGQEVSIPYARDTMMCAVTAMKEWLEVSGITSGHVFRKFEADRRTLSRDDEPMSSEAIRALVHDYGAKAALEGKITPHSLRAGFCTTAALAGKDITQIAKHARHTAIQTTMGYVRVAERFKNNAGNGLL